MSNQQPDYTITGPTDRLDYLGPWHHYLITAPGKRKPMRHYVLAYHLDENRFASRLPDDALLVRAIGLHKLRSPRHYWLGFNP